MKHIPKWCDVIGCTQEATYWIDTGEGFVESLLAKSTKAPSANQTFYLCIDHQYMLMNQETGMYTHLRVDTGEVHELEIGSYSCSPDCHDCNN